MSAHATWVALVVLTVGSSIPSARCQPAAAIAAQPPVEAVQKLALRHAGLDAPRLHSHLTRVRWAAALPELRFRVVSDVDRDGRTTIRLADSRWLGDVAAVDTHGRGLRLQGEVLWRPGELLGGRDELAALKEMRAAAAARRALIEAVTAAYFARWRALEALAGADGAQTAAEAEADVAEHTALLDGLTGGRFSEAVPR